MELPPDVAARLLPPPTPGLGTEGGLLAQLSLSPPDLKESERVGWELLSTEEAAHIDALAAASQLTIPELTGKCFVKKL